MANHHISHKGVVKEIREGSLDVLIISQSACSSCKTKHLCSISETKEKIITIHHPKEAYLPGEEVNVIMSQSMGTLAVFYAYMLPFIIMISLMIVESYTGTSEPIIGLTVVVFLVAYFFILYAFRKKLNRKFSFIIKKL